MSLETVVEDIRDEARKRAEDIREAGEARAEEIIADAEADAEEIIADAKADVEAEITQEREQRLSSAKLEAKQKRLEARRDALAEVREQVEHSIATLEGDDREELTRSLLEAADEEFDADDEKLVYVRPGDDDLISDILEDYDSYEYGGEYDCLGGVVVESQASRVRVNNTFDSVLEQVWEDDLKAISERLFEQ